MQTNFNATYITKISLISALGGLLFGYDWVVIGGAKPFYELFFQITQSAGLQGWAMSSALVGCLAGALLSGLLSDKYGRKRLLILSAFLFTLSALGTGASNTFSTFIIYRIIGGVGIGLASNLSPMYIAEITPGIFRGKFVSVNQLTIVIGILAAQIVNWFIAEPVAETASSMDILNSWNGQRGWRWMFWAEIVPAVFFFTLMFFMPESPRWLAKNGNHDKIVKTLRKIGGKEYAENEFQSIRESLNTKKNKVNLEQLKDHNIRIILIIGIVLAVFQQWCGINVIFNYAEEVFKAAGFGVSDMLLNIVVTGIINLVFTFVAMNTVDKLGRRKLMLIGSGGLAFIYLLVGGAYYFQISGWILLFLVLLAIAVYAMSLAPIVWVVISEIFPNRIRGVAMSIATFSLWAASFALTYTFPHFNRILGASGTFWVYGLICLLGWLFIYKKLPETKGKSLEEIEKDIIS